MRTPFSGICKIEPMDEVAILAAGEYSQTRDSVTTSRQKSLIRRIAYTV